MKHPNPVDPFVEVQIDRTINKFVVRATILMEPDSSVARTALAIDASASMQPNFGVKLGPFPSPKPNLVEPVAKALTAFLSKFSSDGKCATVYWACGPDGSAIEEIGRFTANEVLNAGFSGPQKNVWGKQTRLLPPVKHFVENVFQSSPWSIGVIITDGIIDDLIDVKNYCLKIGLELASGQRQYFKLVLIGVGDQIDQAQLNELNNMFVGSGKKLPSGSDVDIWDHKIASEMNKLEEIFTEIVDESTIVVASGRIVDDKGRIAREYAQGLPAVLKFELPLDSGAFRLEWADGSVEQSLT